VGVAGLDNGNVVNASSEFLQAGGTELVMEFMVAPSDIDVSDSSLKDQSCYTVDLASVVSCLIGDTDIQVRSLTGDVAGSAGDVGNGTTNTTDSAAIRQRFLDSIPPTGQNVQYDINANGQTNQTDASLVRDIAFSGGIGVACP
jgi:hypothetical protein